MADWKASMQQTFEYWVVDPNTWKDVRRLDSVLSCTITRDISSGTLGSATIDITESVGECYIRVYLITIQNGIRERHPLGTYLVQTPSFTFDGRLKQVSMDAYTPLLELNENPPPLGYYLAKGVNIMDQAYELTTAHMRAPVVMPKCDTTLFSDFVADPNDTWLSYVASLMSNAKYSFDLDEMGRVLYVPDQDFGSLQPVWTYDDGDQSILFADLSVDQDLYGIPNTVEVIYSNGKQHYYGKAVNEDSNSPVSTVSRGREIIYRVTDPNLAGDPTQEQVDDYAKQYLRSISSLEHTVTYTHGYCPVRAGDCVRINYSKAGIYGVKAKVISQSIKCEPGCPVTEKAVYTTNLWR